MTIRVAAVTLAAVSMLALAACDSRDYEAEIAKLQGDLQNAQSENEKLQKNVEELQGKAEQAVPEDARANAQTELNKVVKTAATTFQQMGSMSQQTNVSPDQRTEALNAMRADLQGIVQSVQAAADDLGVKLETVSMDTDADATEGAPQPEPAAGAESNTQKQPQEPAAQNKEPAAQNKPPADTETKKPSTSQ